MKCESDLGNTYPCRGCRVKEKIVEDREGKYIPTADAIALDLSITTQSSDAWTGRPGRTIIRCRRDIGIPVRDGAQKDGDAEEVADTDHLSGYTGELAVEPIRKE